MKTFGSYLSGMGMIDAGALEAGFAPVFGVEFDPGNAKISMAIADMHERNIPSKFLFRMDVCKIDPAWLYRVTWFHASPVCKQFSTANVNAGELETDIAVAEAVSRYIAYHKPPIVTIENVYAYRNSESWHIIEKTLAQYGYSYAYWHVNMVSYGVPQTRRRMIVIARLDGKKPMLPPKTHEKNPVPGIFGTMPRWVSWYEAIEDLIPTLPDSEFADWQLKRLPNELKTMICKGGDNYSFIMDGANASNDAKPRGNEPSQTVTGSVHKTAYRAFIVDGQANSKGKSVTVRRSDAPAFTSCSSDHKKIGRAFIANDGDSKNTIIEDNRPMGTVTAQVSRLSSRAAVHGRVVKMTPRALARFQSLPDWYKLSGHTKTDCIAIGNGVPSLFAQRLGEWLAKTL